MAVNDHLNLGQEVQGQGVTGYFASTSLVQVRFDSGSVNQTTFMERKPKKKWYLLLPRALPGLGPTNRRYEHLLCPF